jgi:Protein of unknown function (DUF3500)
MNGPHQNAPPIPRRGGLSSVAVFTTVLLLGIALYVSRSPLQEAPADGPKEKKPTTNAVVAANKFLDALTAKQREKALYEFGSAKKSAWSNLPVTFVPRNGVELADLTKEQKTLAMEVVAAVLSKSGYQKVVDIMEGDQKLAEGGGGKGKGDKDKGEKGKGGKGMFGADKYYLAIFGTPSEKEAWMVQFGGHHLGINVTVIGKHFVLTPTHTGAQPSLFKRGETEVRPLGLENDTAFKLVNALDENQKAKAITGAKAQQELLLGPGQDAKKVPAPEGIKGSALTAKQQAMLVDVIAAWVEIVESDAAKARMEEIKGKIGETYFSWKGPTEKGSAAYVRVQGPTVWIEYAPQGGTNHIHTVIRNPNDDYGAGLLKSKG